MLAVVDYGLGNLRSVAKALETAGAKVEVASRPEAIEAAEGVVLPGVGAFARGRENLEKLNLIPLLKRAARDGRPFLGICLGMQLLFSESAEHKKTPGLDIVKGRVVRFSGKLKVPHMGWNQLKKKKNTGLLRDIPGNSYFYFVHSFFAVPQEEAMVAGTSDYGVEFAAAINRDNLWGVQFHPEKSGPLGIAVLKNFIQLTRER